MKVKLLSVGTYGGMEDAIGKVFTATPDIAKGVLISGAELAKIGVYACREDQSLYFRNNEIEYIKEDK